MSGDRESSGRPGFDAEVERALRAVDRPAARPELREELRRRFLDVAQARSPSSRRRAPRIVGLLAAAAVFAAGYFLLRTSAPGWRVLEIAPGSIVRVDGAVLPLHDSAALARGLEDAREIVVERGDLVLQAGDLSLFDIGEGTRVAFAGFDREGDFGSLAVRASSGRLRARTGPGFRGRTMRVQADLMEVVVTGTAFAVDYEEEGTCVCCLHGTVEIASKAVGPDSRAVQPGKMCLVFRDERSSRAPIWGESPKAHAEPLERLEARAREIWR